jgi:CubicO group peptidase (beta-lactamase class C family)
MRIAYRVSILALYGVSLALAVSACDNPSIGSVDQVPTDPVDSLLTSAIAARNFPAASVALGSGDHLVKSAGYGTFSYDDGTPVTDTTRFDLASLTKVVATTTAMMMLVESGRVNLDEPVANYVPEFGSNGKSVVTIRHLMQHRGGLVPFRRYYLEPNATRESVLHAILGDTLVYKPGEAERYSDLGFIVLGLLVERVTGMGLAAFARDSIFVPLGMHATAFRPTDGTDAYVVPTEIDSVFRQRLVQGEVHDENAFVLGGAAGHAGLFSTARDLARFARMLLGNGNLDGLRFLHSTTVAEFTRRDRFTQGERALGWDFKSIEGYSSAGEHFGGSSFGHTGFTGTSIWMDPEADVFAILLTNRVYPSRRNTGHTQIRPKFADLAFEMVTD